MAVFAGQEGDGEVAADHLAVLPRAGPDLPRRRRAEFAFFAALFEPFLRVALGDGELEARRRVGDGVFFLHFAVGRARLDAAAFGESDQPGLECRGQDAGAFDRAGDGTATGERDVEDHRLGVAVREDGVELGAFVGGAAVRAVRTRFEFPEFEGQGFDQVAVVDERLVLQPARPRLRLRRLLAEFPEAVIAADLHRDRARRDDRLSRLRVGVQLGGRAFFERFLRAAARERFRRRRRARAERGEHQGDEGGERVGREAADARLLPPEPGA